MTRTETKFTSVEICAGAGGQALGLHWAGFRHVALIEIDDNACATLRKNVEGNPEWRGCKVIQADLTKFDWESLGLRPRELDLLAGGVPCPPFSAAGKQLGREDERDLFPVMLNLVRGLEPKAVLIENVRGLLEPPHKFADYRKEIEAELRDLKYEICYWKVLEACDYGVPQLRPRAILVAMRREYYEHFDGTEPEEIQLRTVAEALADTMKERYEDSGRPDWKYFYDRWLEKVRQGTVAPTLVGGSKKHGGADLGPSRAKAAWKKLGVDGLGVANEPEDLKDPDRDLFGDLGPKLTVSQAAIIQGFPPEWRFEGRKTAAYRQVGNAFPPPVAQAVGEQIIAALRAGAKVAAVEGEPEPDHGQGGVLFDLPAASVPPGAELRDRDDDLGRAVGW